jgi:hypothetical protein
MLVAVSLAIAPVAAQVTAPAAFGAAEAPTNQFGITQVDEVTYQVQYAAAQLVGLSVGQQITGVQFRLDSGEPAQNLNYASYSLQISQAANAITGMSPSFAANMLNPVTVYNAPLTFTAASMPTGSTPNAFGPSISFTAPYIYQGGDLVLLFRHSTSETGTVSGVGLDADNANNTNTGYRAQFDVFQNSEVASNTTATVAVTRFVTANAAAPEPGSLALLVLTGLPVAGAVIRRNRVSRPSV